MSITAGDDRPHESKHIAFMSSQVLNGAGYGIVIRCGDNTFIGMINSLSAAAKGRETTLQRDVARCVMIIAIIATTMAICLFSAGLIRGMSFVKAFVNGIIVVLVANIPQGLPATVASALTLTAEKMKAVNVLVKRTDIIESLGCSTRIASDKTGTLTQNKMTVINCWVNCQFRSAREVIATVHKPVSPPKRSLSRQIDRGNLSQGNVSSSAAHRANDSDMSDIGLSAGFPRSTNLNKQTSKVPRLPGSSPHGQDVLSRMSLGMGAAVRSLHLFMRASDIRQKGHLAWHPMIGGGNLSPFPTSSTAHPTTQMVPS
jgi:magnesium-transporting ATPase (P-type)